MLPSLVRHLSSENYVCYTYAAISIERILFIRQGNQPMCVIYGLSFSVAAQPVMQVLDGRCQGNCASDARCALFQGREGAYPRKGRGERLPDEVSVNCPSPRADADKHSTGAMRVIVTARSGLADGYQRLLQRLVAILGVISKNPSNPNFDQYIFESISALLR